MQSLSAFTIHAPATASEASGIAATLQDEAALYAGGTELLLAMKLGALRYGHLIDLKGVPELRSIELASDGTAVGIGAAATYAQILRSPVVRDNVPAVADVVAGIGNVRVRTSGTLGGSLAFADPHSDVSTIGLGLDARCEVLDAKGVRSTTIEELLVGPYETSLNTADLISRVWVPCQRDRVVRYQRFRVHERPAVAVCVSAVLRDGVVQDPRVVVGAAVPVATRCAAAEAILAGDVATVAGRARDVADATETVLEIEDDLEGSAEYKRHLIQVFVARLTASLTDAGETVRR